MNVKQNRKIPVIIALVLVLIVVGISIYMSKNEEEVVSEETADLSQLYYSDDGTIPIIANGSLSEIRALVRDRHAYISLRVLLEEINDGFFWDDIDNCLIYTTPSEVIRARAADQFEGEPVFFDNSDAAAKKDTAPEDRVFVAISYIAKYSNISVEVYSNPARVFMRNDFGEKNYLTIKKGTALRLDGDSSSAVIVKTDENAEARELSRDGDWVKVYLGGTYGHVGYVNKSDIESEKLVEEEPVYSEEPYVRRTVDEPICMAWHQTLSSSGKDELPGLLENARTLNIICPTWFSVESSSGEISCRADSEYVSYAHERGLKVWALIENFNTASKLDYNQLLQKSSSRKALVDNLIAKALEYEIDGLNLDFEVLPKDIGDAYIQFVKELAIACHENDLVFSVDNYVPSAWTAQYHRADQAKYIDYFIIMAYDEHYDGSEAGSTASLPFVENGLINTVKEGIPSEMIIVGVPFYSRLWKGEDMLTESEAINMKSMSKMKSDYEDFMKWDNDSGQYYIEVEIEDVLNRVWVEDTESLTEKLSVIKRHNTAGISCWKIGMETTGVWDVFAKELMGEQAE